MCLEPNGEALGRELKQTARTGIHSREILVRGWPPLRHEQRKHYQTLTRISAVAKANAASREHQVLSSSHGQRLLHLRPPEGGEAGDTLRRRIGWTHNQTNNIFECGAGRRLFATTITTPLANSANRGRSDSHGCGVCLWALLAVTAWTETEGICQSTSYRRAMYIAPFSTLVSLSPLPSPYPLHSKIRESLLSIIRLH